ncbi:MAG: cobalt ECF transporter T component CbiQ [Blastochloris sp.]|nr:cobalt ECF transporter T component CbiQ [Blastochloris sp.]
MHIIDRYAYTNRLRSVDPAQKAGLAVLVIVLCLLLNRPLVGVVAIGWMWILTTHWAGVPKQAFGRVLLAEGMFLCLAVVGIALSFSTDPPVLGTSWAWQVGSVWVSSSPSAVATAVLLVTRALGSAAAMNFLAMTTPLIDIINLLQRLCVPALLIDLMTVIYRFIFTLLESLNRMRVSQDSRLGYRTFWRGMMSAGTLASQLFIDAYRRSQRLQTALDSRGYVGTLQVLPIHYQRSKHVLWLGVAISASMVLAWVIV